MSDPHALGSLLERSRQGDRQAWNTLLGRLRPFVRALFRRSGPFAGDGSDLTQEVQLRMDRGFRQFRGDSVPQFLAWVRQIAARVFIDHGRRQPPPAEPLPPDPAGPPAGHPASGLDRAEEMVRLAEALKGLKDDQRMVIEARLFDGLACVEIARRLGRTPGWVRITCMRAVEKLREQWGKPS
jgi:RNA polymerase sigma-70 factor (ECF subfamily)